MKLVLLASYASIATSFRPLSATVRPLTAARMSAVATSVSIMSSSSFIRLYCTIRVKYVVISIALLNATVLVVFIPNAFRWMHPLQKRNGWPQSRLETPFLMWCSKPERVSIPMWRIHSTGKTSLRKIYLKARELFCSVFLEPLHPRAALHTCLDMKRHTRKWHRSWELMMYIVSAHCIVEAFTNNSFIISPLTTFECFFFLQVWVSMMPSWCVSGAYTKGK